MGFKRERGRRNGREYYAPAIFGRGGKDVKDTAMGVDVGECGYPEALIACPDFLLSTLAFSVTELIEDALAPLDLRLRHYRLLRLLFFDGPQRQSDLGRALQADRTTVVSLVDHLERKRLAKRVRAAGDRRVYVVSLTAKGRGLAQRAVKLTTELERRMFAPLAGDEQETLRRLSTRLLAAPGPIAATHTAAASSGENA